MKIDKILHENHIKLYKLNYANEKNLHKYQYTFCCLNLLSKTKRHTICIWDLI